MKLAICKKCNKSKAQRFKSRLEKHLGKKKHNQIQICLTGCLGGCKGMTAKFDDQKRMSKVKLKDLKKLVDEQ